MVMDREVKYGNSVAFYKGKVKQKGKLFNRIFQLDPYFEEMIGDKKEIKIADLGSGMFSTTGSTWPDTIVHIFPSDYLADEYMQVLEKGDVDVVIPIERQDMTALTYEDNFFDIVHCVNALDHCEKPLKAIEEMYRVCKPGGWIYLKHRENNAIRWKYTGLHQWNICKEGDNFCIFNKENDDTVFGFTNILDNGYLVSKLRKE